MGVGDDLSTTADDTPIVSQFAQYPWPLNILRLWQHNMAARLVLMLDGNHVVGVKESVLPAETQTHVPAAKIMTQQCTCVAQCLTGN